MMGYYGNCYSGWFPTGLIQGLLALLLIVFVFRFIRYARRGGGPNSMNWRSWRGDSAEDLLKERFVKGEISKEEYAEKLRVIRDDIPKK